ncbi:MAG: TniQ family protein [Rhodospirillales bacterium]|nr:TniQ family protein [Rhodospirillales bacterium]
MPSAELFEVEELPPETTILAHQASLPSHATPLPGEALPSWMFRFCEPFGMSPASLLLHDLELGDGAWWRHPSNEAIASIARRTRLTEDQVRTLTFASWAPDTLADQIPERFARVRFGLARPTGRLSHRITVCPQCLAEDETPYIRKAWLLGWLAACTIHGTVLLAECPECHAKLRMPPAYSPAFAPDRCGRCGLRFARVRRQPALDLITHLQDALILGRASGMVILPGLGALPWPLTMALFDVLLGMVWVGTKVRRRQLFLDAIATDVDCATLSEDRNSGNYDGLLILAWLLDRWPAHFPIALARLHAVRPRRQLDRWPDLNVDIRTALELLLVPAGPDDRHRPDRGAGMRWLNNLSETEADLRALAVTERAPERRVRLHTLASLRGGMSVVEAAIAAGVRDKTVRRWLRCGAAADLEAVLLRRNGSALNRGPAAEIGAWLSRHPQNNGRWKGEYLQRKVFDEFGVEITMHAALNLLKRHKPQGRRGRSCTPLTPLPDKSPVAD